MIASENGLNQNQILVTWIIWSAMLVTLLIYVLICHLVGDGIRQSISPDFPLTMLRNVLGGIGLIVHDSFCATVYSNTTNRWFREHVFEITTVERSI